MNTPLLPLPLPTPILDPVKRKRVLLIDSSHAKRDLRAEVMRKLGMDVDIAADITEASIWWKPALYDLVLIHMEKGHGQRDKFCDQVRSASPPQRLAFLVGCPEYLSDSPNVDQESAMKSGDEAVAIATAKSISAVDSRDPARRWGILEASRQISVVRSALIARTHAMRSMPPPVRDLEGRTTKPGATALCLDDLLKEELR